jgi:hypothetical protein
LILLWHGNENRDSYKGGVAPEGYVKKGWKQASFSMGALVGDQGRDAALLGTLREK